MIKVRAMYEADSTALDWNAAYRSDFYASQSLEDGLRSVANGYWFAMLILAGGGARRQPRAAERARLALLPLMVLTWTAFHLLFFGDSRFHYPIVFAFALLGARGFVVVFDALRRPQAIARQAVRCGVSIETPASPRIGAAPTDRAASVAVEARGAR